MTGRWSLYKEGVNRFLARPSPLLATVRCMHSEGDRGAREYGSRAYIGATRYIDARARGLVLKPVSRHFSNQVNPDGQ